MDKSVVGLVIIVAGVIVFTGVYFILNPEKNGQVLYRATITLDMEKT